MAYDRPQSSFQRYEREIARWEYPEPPTRSTMTNEKLVEAHNLAVQRMVRATERKEYERADQYGETVKAYASELLRRMEAA